MLHTEIEIAAPPEEVREVFMDFPKYPDWTKGFIRSIEVLPPKETIEKGDTLKVGLEGITIQPVVLENSPNEFKWRGSGYGLFVGEHSFRFEPSKTTPGSTTLIHSEEFFSLLILLMQPIFPFHGKTKAGFEGFDKDLKARVESLR